MLGAHPINDPIWNLNSTMSDKEEEVDKNKLITMLDYIATNDDSQDFQQGHC